MPTRRCAGGNSRCTSGAAMYPSRPDDARNRPRLCLYRPAFIVEAVETGMTRDVLLGVVIGAQGLKGDVKVKTFTEMPDNLRAYGPLHTRDGRKLTISELRDANGFAIVRFDGVDNRDAAESMKGVELHVSRATLPGTHEQ